MITLDKIIEFLHYHPGTGRRDLMSALSLEIKDSQMKNVLAEGVRNGDLYTEGKARATRYFITRKAHLLRTIDLDTYYAVGIDQRQMDSMWSLSSILPHGRC